MKYNRILFTIVFIASSLGYTAMYAAPAPWERVGGEASSLLSQIEKNNTTLKALRTEAEARKLENRTGITLADPEVGYKHMWEGAGESGKLTELTVTQSIDLATATGQRSRVARQQNMLVDEEYRMARMEILLDAQLALIDLDYYNALSAELDRRLGHAHRVVEAEKARFDSGDTDVLSYNNVLLSLSALEAERARVAMEREVLIAQLTALNGGIAIGNLDNLGSQGNIECQDDQDFTSWYAEAEPYLPQLAQARQLREVRSSELALTKTEHLPSLSATYINERHTIGTRSQGVAVGMSLPLWSNKNRVRSARTALEAAEARQADTELRLRSVYAQEFARVKGLYHTATLYRRALDEANNSELLQRAMDEGFISVLEYLQGIELYYDYLDRSLAAERDYRRAVAELEAWRL
ncbi:MAG: TolC family protein [Bacteroidaceae bacterium]|nr:TolC family protein [Bacteroidaceae bacterium]